MVLLQFAGAVESSGQESSWLRNGTMWYYNYHEGMDDPRSGFIKCVISGDTIVEDRTCKILNKSLTRYNGEVIQLNKVILLYDTVNQRVYRRMDEKFALLYDFGAAIGDTIAIPVGENNIIKDTLEIIISAKSNTIFNDTLLLETQHFSYIGPFDWYLGDSAIEYIGSNAYFFPTSQLQCDAGCADQLRCYSNDQFNIRMPESDDCEYLFSSINHQKSNYSAQIFPNPASEYIEVHCDFQEINLMELYDITGRLAKTVNIENPNKNPIDVSMLKAGIYFAVLRNRQEILAVEKFFKTD